MGEPISVTCPYCGESQTVWIDPASLGEMTHDCAVCCQPWLLVVWRSEAGEIQVRLERSSGY